MIGWATAVKVAWGLFRGSLGGGSALSRVSELLSELKQTESETRRAEIEKEIVEAKLSAELRQVSISDPFSPMRIGQYLIVVPYGAWWAAVCVVSVLDPYTSAPLVIQDLPPRFHDLATWWVPAILFGTFLETRK